MMDASTIAALMRHLKGTVSLCNEALIESDGMNTLSSLLRDLAVKSQAALIELKKEPVKAG
jgi:hypothetical protein